MEVSYYSNGKLLITGEYAVLDGALSLALPCKFGQSMTVLKTTGDMLFWKSLDEKGFIWFETQLNINELHVDAAPDAESSERIALIKILEEARKLNPLFLNEGMGYIVETRLTFPKEWGLGTSSTLINNIAQWAKVDAFRLLWNSFGGSGYDIACAQNDQAILYKLEKGFPQVKKIRFDPSFKDSLFFVYLNKKQSSREAILSYGKKLFNRKSLINEISQITLKLVACKDLNEFEKLLETHEKLISEVLECPTLKEYLFPDYFGTMKSLGAWGGDFALVTGNQNTVLYFKAKGYETVIPFSLMTL